MKRFFLIIISFIAVSLAGLKAETNDGQMCLRGSAVEHNSDVIRKIKRKLGADEIKKQAQRIVEGNIEGLTLDKSGKVVGDTEFLRKLKLKLGEIFAVECKRKTAKEEFHKFWELVKKDKDFLEEIGKNLLTNRIRMGMSRPPRTFPKEMLVRLAISGMESYSEEEGPLIEDEKIKHSAKKVILGSLQPWQHTLKNRLLLRDRFIVEEIAKRENKAVVMDIGIAAGASSYWYVSKSLRLFQNKENILPGVTFIDLADKLAGYKGVKLIGIDIETAGLKDLLKDVREGKRDEALKEKYLNPQINYLCCDLADKLPVKDESIDIVSVADVFPYILRDELRIEALSNIHRALKEEGLLVFVEPKPMDKVAHGKIMTKGTTKEKRESIAKAFSNLDYEIYRKEKQKLVYQGRLSWNEAKEAELKKGDEEPQLDNYLNIPFWARAVFPDINVRRSPQELIELGDLNKQRAMILNEELFMDNPGAAFHIINTNRQLAKEKGLKLVLALSEPSRTDIFYEAIKEAVDGDVDLKGQFDYVVSAEKTAMDVIKDVQDRFPGLESIEVIGPEKWAKEFGDIPAGKGIDAKQCIVIVCRLGKGNYVSNGAGAFESGLKALLLDTEILAFEEREKIDRLKDKKTGFFVVEAKKIGKETQAIIKNYREVLVSK